MGVAAAGEEDGARRGEVEAGGGGDGVEEEVASGSELAQSSDGGDHGGSGGGVYEVLRVLGFFGKGKGERGMVVGFFSLLLSKSQGPFVKFWWTSLKKICF